MMGRFDKSKLTQTTASPVGKHNPVTDVGIHHGQKNTSEDSVLPSL